MNVFVFILHRTSNDCIDIQIGILACFNDIRCILKKKTDWGTANFNFIFISSKDKYKVLYGLNVFIMV